VTLAPARLAGRERYERVMDGWVDNTHDDALTHTVHLAEPERAVEVAIVARPSPTYEIREARCRALRGDLDPAVVAGFPRLSGVALVAGLTRRVAEATGHGAGAALVLDATIEAARLGGLGGKLPPARAVEARAGAWACWRLDTTSWVDLPDSCFTYSEAGRALFATRTVTSPMTPELYCPRPGQRRVFVRKKVARLERRAEILALSHSMHDNAHGFEIAYEVDTVSGRVLRAQSVTPRLPYAGICSEPQRRIDALVGEIVDDGLRKRIQAHLGGAAGCAQLYDLTADLLKLVVAREG
jgi:hypothetical protein